MLAGHDDAKLGLAVDGRAKHEVFNRLAAGAVVVVVLEVWTSPKVSSL
jgi:hypothetical protein